MIKLDNYDVKIAICNDIITRFGKSEETALLEYVAKALFNKSITLDEQGRHEDEIAVYDEIIARFKNSKKPKLLKYVASALLSKSMALDELERHDDVMAIYDYIISRFGKCKETSLLEIVASALFNKGLLLDEIERFNEAIAIYDDIVSRFGKSEETALLEYVASALLSKSKTWDELGRHDDEIAIYNDIVSRFGKSEETALLEYVAKALSNKAITLAEIGRRDDGIAICDEIIARFGKSKNLDILNTVVRALGIKVLNANSISWTEKIKINKIIAFINLFKKLFNKRINSERYKKVLSLLRQIVHILKNNKIEQDTADVISEILLDNERELIKIGQKDDAIQTWKLICELEEKYADSNTSSVSKNICKATQCIAKMMCQAGEYEEALTTIVKLEKMNNPDLDCCRGTVFMLMGKYPEAIDAYYVALKLRIDHSYYYQLAAAWYRVGNMTLAKDNIQKALDSVSHLSDNHDKKSKKQYKKELEILNNPGRVLTWWSYWMNSKHILRSTFGLGILGIIIFLLGFMMYQFFLVVFGNSHDFNWFKDIQILKDTWQWYVIPLVALFILLLSPVIKNVGTQGLELDPSAIKTDEEKLIISLDTFTKFSETTLPIQKKSEETTSEGFELG